ncbi:MAG: hypothetical protein MHMPM18_002253 [Marteilia pararefringens]
MLLIFIPESTQSSRRMCYDALKQSSTNQTIRSPETIDRICRSCGQILVFGTGGNPLYNLTARECPTFQEQIRGLPDDPETLDRLIDCQKLCLPYISDSMVQFQNISGLSGLIRDLGGIVSTHIPIDLDLTAFSWDKLRIETFRVRINRIDRRRSEKQCSSLYYSFLRKIDLLAAMTSLYPDYYSDLGDNDNDNNNNKNNLDGQIERSLISKLQCSSNRQDSQRLDYLRDLRTFKLLDFKDLCPLNVLVTRINGDRAHEQSDASNPVGDCSQVEQLDRDQANACLRRALNLEQRGLDLIHIRQLTKENLSASREVPDAASILANLNELQNKALGVTSPVDKRCKKLYESFDPTRSQSQISPLAIVIIVLAAMFVLAVVVIVAISFHRRNGHQIPGTLPSGNSIRIVEDQSQGTGPSCNSIRRANSQTTGRRPYEVTNISLNLCVIFKSVCRLKALENPNCFISQMRIKENYCSTMSLWRIQYALNKLSISFRIDKNLFLIVTKINIKKFK